MSTRREAFPLRTGMEELIDFRTGRIIGPLSRVAMSYQNEWQNILQLSGEYNAVEVDYPHYPLETDELKQANPIRDENGEVVAWIPWRDSGQTEAEE